jgi:hypothetical protein
MSCLLQSSCKRRRLHGEIQYTQTGTTQPIIRRLPIPAVQHVLIMDTGGGVNPTITANAWKVTHKYNVTMSMSGYQSKDPPLECSVVNAVTKVQIPGRMDPVIFEVHYATLVMDENEYESLLVPFEMMKHGVKVDMIPPKYGGTGSIMIDDELLPFLFDDEKLYWKISKPTQDDLDVLKWFELNQPALLGETRIRRRKQHDMPHNIPWDEWRCRLAMLPEDVVNELSLMRQHNYTYRWKMRTTTNPESTTRVFVLVCGIFDRTKPWLLTRIFLQLPLIKATRVLSFLLVWILIFGLLILSNQNRQMVMLFRITPAHTGVLPLFEPATRKVSSVKRGPNIAGLM